MATEIADAYIALYAKMPGVKKDIEKGLGGAEAQGAAEKSGKSLGGGLMGGLSKVMKGGALAVGATIATGLGVSLVKGFGRLDAIDQASAKLDGLGHSAASVDTIMDNALSAVKGTAFGLDEAATSAATAVAAGIKPGSELAGYLKLTADTAAIAGASLGDVGRVMNNVTTLGAAYNDSLQILAQKGLPIYTWLAQSMGVTEAAVKDLASQGQISSEQFRAAIEKNVSGAALSMGDTFSGAGKNILASLGRIGAGLMGGIFPYLAPLMQAITTALGPLETIAAGIGEKIGAFIGPALQWLTDTLNSGIDVSGFLDILSVLSPLGLAFKVLQPVLPMLLDSFMQIASVLGGAVSSVFAALLPAITELAGVFSGVLAQVLPMILPVLQDLAGVFASLLVAVAPLVGELVSALMPAVQMLMPIIAALMPVFSQLIGMLIPIIQAILPVLSSLIQTLAPIFTQLIAAILPILTPILALLTPLLDLVGMILPPLIQLLGFLIETALVPLGYAFDAIIPLITGVVEAISAFLIPIIETITNVIGGLITFLTGVFMGDWEMVWKGVEQIFSGIWDGIQDIAKGAINFIIDLINGVIAGLNGLASGIADATGGAIDLRIGEIPRLADGGVIARRPGGIIANIGEGRYDEAVVPLSPGVLAQLGGGGDRGDVNVYVDGTGMDEHTVGTIIGDKVGFVLRGAA